MYNTSSFSCVQSDCPSRGGRTIELRGTRQAGKGQSMSQAPWKSPDMTFNLIVLFSSSASGSCRWIRIPAIIYAVHTITTLIPVLSTFLLEDFSKAVAFKGVRPENFRERLTLIGVYVPYLIIPIILLLFMLRNPYYKNEEKRKKK